jgi:hypothetical protein
MKMERGTGYWVLFSGYCFLVTVGAGNCEQWQLWVWLIITRLRALWTLWTLKTFSVEAPEIPSGGAGEGSNEASS